MKKNGYAFQDFFQTQSSYTFLSIGRQGSIIKIVYFEKISDDVYNLVLGDYNATISPPVDDAVVSDNGDLAKIMITVVHIAEDFLNQNPNFFVYLEGNTVTKKQLYQRIMRNNYQDFIVDYDIFGIDLQNDVVPFETTQEYNAFLIRKKI
jgi:hypothetical protein